MTLMRENVRSIKTFGSDFQILAFMLAAISALSLFFIASASAIVSLNEYGTSWGMLQRQIIAMIAGAAFMTLIARRSLSLLRKLSPLLVVIAIALLVYVLIAGKSVAGQKNWIMLPMNFSFQPSEVAKLALVVFCAQVISAGIAHGSVGTWTYATLMMATGVIVFLVLLERDLGTPIILAGIATSIFYVAGLRKRYLALGWLFGAVAVIGYSFAGAGTYREERFLAWLDPFSAPQTYGYQILHGQYALASGGLWGVGPGNSTQKFGALPAPHTDFILAVIGEEFGIIGTTVVIGSLIAVFVMALRISERALDDFGRLAAFGIAMWIAVQTIVNVGAIVRALPITGVPLPFYSYGGSSAAITLVAMGLLLAIARDTHRQTILREMREADYGDHETADS